MRGLACVADVSDALLRFVDELGGQEVVFADCMVAARRDASCAVVYFFGGCVFRAGDRKVARKGSGTRRFARQTIWRGAEILWMGLLFRVQEFALGYPWSPWTDLLRVDVLNILGLSMMLMGVLCWATGDGAIAAVRIRTLGGGIFAAVMWQWRHRRFGRRTSRSFFFGPSSLISMASTSSRSRGRWLFPLFPWRHLLLRDSQLVPFSFSDVAKRRRGCVALLGGTGNRCCYLSVLFDSSRVRLYAVYDYWHSNPNFRAGCAAAFLLIISFWFTGGAGGDSHRKVSADHPAWGILRVLVYWVHIEFVYGRFRFWQKGQCSALKATVGLIAIFLAMLALSLVRTNWKSGRSGLHSRI